MVFSLLRIDSVMLKLFLDHYLYNVLPYFEIVGELFYRFPKICLVYSRLKLVPVMNILHIRVKFLAVKSAKPWRCVNAHVHRAKFDIV